MRGASKGLKLKKTRGKPGAGFRELWGFCGKSQPAKICLTGQFLELYEIPGVYALVGAYPGTQSGKSLGGKLACLKIFILSAALSGLINY